MREHTKSRRGCLRCKRRKVKCDETLPSCRRCTQRQEICSYVGEFGVVSSSPGPSTQHTSPAPAPAPQPQPQPQPQPPQPDSQLYLIDLDLTHQYLTCTYSTLWGSETGKLVWRDNVFRMALTTPTVLAGLLATAAMHRISMSGASPELENIALQKQTEVLEGLRLGLQNINAENCDEVFALSTLVSFWTFASRTLPERVSLLSTHAETENGPMQSAISQFIELLRKVKPLRAVTRESRPWLQQGNLTGLLKLPRPDDLPELSDGTKCALAELEHQLQLHTTLTSTSTGDLPAFTMEFMFRLSRCPDLSELLVGWPVQLSEQLIEDLKHRDHAALTLLAYWAVCFDAMNSRWWSTGWSKALVHEISTIVQGRWLELLRFPKAALAIPLS